MVKKYGCMEEEDLNAAFLAGIIDDIDDDDLEDASWKPTTKPNHLPK